ncbi:unnamed protein product, partial [Didymodactylos carnosus]
MPPPESISAGSIDSIKKSRQIKELKLAMAWNKFDLVISSMLNDKIITEWTENELDQGLEHALYLGSVGFTELLINYGASFNRLRRLIKMKKYYRNIKNPDLLPLGEDDNIGKDGRQYKYYTIYLDKKGKLAFEQEDFEQRKRFPGDSVNRYGSIHGIEVPGHVLCRNVVFSRMDAVCMNGYISNVSVKFQTAQNVNERETKIWLYVLSSADEDKFNILYRCQLTLPKAEGVEKMIEIPDSSVYLEIGQFLAIGFEGGQHQCGYHYGVHTRKSNIAPIKEVDKGYENGQPVEFKEEEEGVTFSFTLIPVQ